MDGPCRQSHAFGEVDRDPKFDSKFFEDVEVLIAHDIEIRLQNISHPTVFDPISREDVPLKCKNALKIGTR
ncbi:hypothetical protein BZL30_4773 [Mycobacterium kansasii]|uniref:Uncharacterized protein n=1 Tax=Mycobacterium kansasii TaxID=1768 RepID=A0A1V3XFF5_MYCKA|nr:hypothetical protein BZL30_4773 [Mycobacterium kansasii]OOK77486.1 hypothetical protein BZL29_3969 [Mycobacterium kansasii]